MMKLVYPWDDSGFTGSVADKASVHENLKKAGYPVTKLGQKKPNDRLLRAVNLVSEAVVRDEWIFVFSNGHGLLQALAKIVPVVYSLTTMLSCMNVTNEKIMNALAAKRPSDDFSDDPAGESLHLMRTAGCLVWEDVVEPVAGSSKQAGRILEILKHRRFRCFPTVFTACYQGQFTEKTLELMLDRLGDNLGSTTRGIIREACRLQHFQVVGKPLRIDTEVI